MFSREELFEYFNDRYSQEQIVEALQILAEHSAITDADAKEFPSAITEQLENILRAAEDAVNQQKALPEVPPTADKFIGGAIAKAQSNLTNLNIDPQLVNGIIRVVFRETIQQAVAIAQVKKDVFNSVLEQTDTDLLQSIAARSAANTQILNSIVNSPDAIQKILASYGIDGGAAARKQLIAASLEDEATSKAQVQSVFAKSAQERQYLKSADYTEVAMAFLLEGLE